MPAGEVEKKKGGSFSIRRAFSSFTGGSRKVPMQQLNGLQPQPTRASQAA